MAESNNILFTLIEAVESVKREPPVMLLTFEPDEALKGLLKWNGIVYHVVPKAYVPEDTDCNAFYLPEGFKMKF